MTASELTGLSKAQWSTMVRTNIGRDHRRSSPSERPLESGPIGVHGRVREYPWGDTAFIPRMMGKEVTSNPQAELWLGAHPALPAILECQGGDVAMDQVKSWAKPGSGDPSFPYLLKVLAAAKPLSIQVHPNQAQAQAGYQSQFESGKKTGSYSDGSHKPELLVALQCTYALAGFRPLSELGLALEQIPEISELLPKWEGTSACLRTLLSVYLGLPNEVLLAAHHRLLTRLRSEAEQGALAMVNPCYWALEADRELGRSGQADRGLLFVFLLNLVRLAPGEGLFIPAGFPHAYLRGAGIELMASSDNVLRCGLTAKPLDVPEMLRVLDCRGAVPPVLRPATVAGERVYRTSAGEFELRSFELSVDRQYTFQALGPELCLAVGALEGGESPARAVLAQLSGPEQEMALRSGNCCLMLNGERGRVVGRGSGTFFRVTRPQQRWQGEMAMTFRGRQPTELSFGTSGLRGLIADITDLEAYINARGFLDFCLANGDVAPGGRIALAGDLRPSTHSEGRSILRAVTRAVVDGGLVPEYFGKIPTPALAYHALQQEIPSIMVTGSHIPFDRNGIKFNRRAGEVLKVDEAGILTCVARVRAEIYGEVECSSIFQDDGMFKASQSPELPEESSAAADAYKGRYQGAFGSQALSGMRVLFYEHSAVGRELIVELLRSLGAEVHPAGRTEQFMAIDTEALAPSMLPLLQKMLDDASSRFGKFDAVVSTDGDSDRPLVLGVGDDGQLSFVSGDRLGILVAEVLKADAVAIPVSSTDAVEAHLEPHSVTVSRTRIGSPYVIAEMSQLVGQRIVGWEANGGFLVGSTVAISGKNMGGKLLPLPTRDAVLPICAVLAQAKATGHSLCDLVAALPSRHTAAGLLDEVPQAASRALLAMLEGEDAVSTLAQYFGPEQGLGPIERIDRTDGIRIFFKSGEIAHLRPSGNAPQLRIYAVADSAAKAQEIVQLGLAEPNGLLRGLLRAGEEYRFVQAVRANIELSERLCEKGGGPAVLGTVSGSASAQAFWQGVLDRAMPQFKARLAISFHEDLPVNQAFGLLLLWQRLRPSLAEGEGALVAFVFGEGSRATPLTETDNGQKPAILSPVRSERSGEGGDYVSMVELAMRHFVPVEAFLRRSGFDGVVVKWGDEVQIPICDLAGVDSRFESADIVRFVSMREMGEDDAANKDWVGVDEAGMVTAFIPRRPLSEMEKLADRGLLTRRGDRLVGGVNLGSIAVSRRMLDALLDEFSSEVNDPAANRKQRPDLDPQLFTALTIAVHGDGAERERLFEQACAESSAMAELRAVMPNVVTRLNGVLSNLEAVEGRPVRVMALDLVDQYWGDIGQHRQMHDFYMALLEKGPDGRIARALARIPEQRDGNGNIFAGDCRVSPRVRITNSVLIDAVIEGEGRVNESVLIGTQVVNVTAERAFDVMSVAPDLALAPRAGTYQVLSEVAVRAEAGERLTTLLLAGGPELYRVHEDTNLRKRAENYDRPILDNARSFAEAHALMSSAGAEEVRERRAQRRAVLLNRGQG